MTEDQLKENLTQYESFNSLMPLLPLLEYSLAEAKELVASTFDAKDFPKEKAESFPFSDLAAYALTFGGSGYWAELATCWLEQGVPINDRIAKAVNLIVETKQATQSVRHRSQRIVRQWQRETAF